MKDRSRWQDAEDNKSSRVHGRLAKDVGECPVDRGKDK
jgi:hypothetical protein